MRLDELAEPAANILVLAQYVKIWGYVFFRANGDVTRLFCAK
jgi:hypothetical protein